MQFSIILVYIFFTCFFPSFAAAMPFFWRLGSERNGAPPGPIQRPGVTATLLLPVMATPVVASFTSAPTSVPTAITPSDPPGAITGHSSEKADVLPAKLNSGALSLHSTPLGAFVTISSLGAFLLL